MKGLSLVPPLARWAARQTPIATPGFFQDHLPALVDVRNRAPVVRDKLTSMYWISRAADVAPLLKDPRCSHNPHTAKSGAIARLAKTNDPDDTARSDMFLVDAPLHARLRRPFQRALGQRDPAELRLAIQSAAIELLDGLDNLATFDVHAQFATPLSVHVVASLVGLGKVDVPALRLEVDDIGRLHDPFLQRRGRLAAIAARRALLARCAELVRSRRQNPTQDLTSQIIRNADPTDPLTDDELAINVARFVVAGVQTTTALICNTMITLLQHPAELAKVRENPDLASKAVEEALRFIPPFSVLPRLTKEPMTVGGCPIGAGQTLMLGVAAANRDPGLLADGDRFDISRPTIPHFSFGGGAHLCLGAALARMEAEIAVQQLLARFPEMTLSAEHPVVWREQVGMTDLRALYVSATSKQ
ncbi:MAG TPA: cytochrome P450 [Polyangium sp.]|nr:cytochrome P450 [Polyangium sp.]